MSNPLSAPEILDREFLEVRAKLLQVAAVLDRFDRATGSIDEDPRLGKIYQAIEMLMADEEGRAEKLQLLFSRPYDPQWRSKFFNAPQ